MHFLPTPSFKEKHGEKKGHTGFDVITIDQESIKLPDPPKKQIVEDKGAQKIIKQAKAKLRSLTLQELLVITVIIFAGLSFSIAYLFYKKKKKSQEGIVQNQTEIDEHPDLRSEDE